MKRSIYTFSILTLMVIGVSTLLQNCTNCPDEENVLNFYNDTFTGKYALAGLIQLPTEDTIEIEINFEDNSAVIRSSLLDTYFYAEYSDVNRRLQIIPFTISDLNFDDTILENVEIGSGFIALDNQYDKLFIKMDDLVINQHNIDGVVAPLNNVDLTTPNFMRRL